MLSKSMMYSMGCSALGYLSSDKSNHFESSENQKIQGVAAVIAKDGRFLLGKRSLHKKSAPGYWCPVTGRIESGETEQDAVIREVSEEVGLNVRPIKKLTSMETRDKTALIHWWIVEIESGVAMLRNDEHSEIGWFTVDEMKCLKNVFQEDLELFLSLP